MPGLWTEKVDVERDALEALAVRDDVIRWLLADENEMEVTA